MLHVVKLAVVLSINLICTVAATDKDGSTAAAGLICLFVSFRADFAASVLHAASPSSQVLRSPQLPSASTRESGSRASRVAVQLLRLVELARFLRSLQRLQRGCTTK